MSYTIPDKGYRVVPLRTWEDTEPYRDYAPEWSIFTCKEVFDAEISKTKSVCYIFLHNGYQDVAKQKGESYPHDDYGLSMIAAVVSSKGEVTEITSRWNAMEANDNMRLEKLWYLTAACFVIGKKFEVLYIAPDGLNYLIDTKKKEARLTIPHKPYKGKVVIPETINYYGKQMKVTGITCNAFYEAEELVSLRIPKTVLRIDYRIFCNCSKLKSIEIDGENPHYYSFYNEICTKGRGKYGLFETHANRNEYHGKPAIPLNYTYEGSYGSSIIVKDLELELVYDSFDNIPAPAYNFHKRIRMHNWCDFTEKFGCDVKGHDCNSCVPECCSLNFRPCDASIYEEKAEEANDLLCGFVTLRRTESNEGIRFGGIE